ncbi:MAG: ABC transporter permease [Phycisphaerae bacterium]|nr:ABC transporter permease [Phycisphaerae bacterium]
MLLTLIQKEITETVLDLRFAVTTLLFVVFIPLGMAVNCKDYERRLDDYHKEHQAFRDQHAEDVDMQIKAEGFRPPSVLSILASGLDPFLPSKIITSRWERWSTQGSVLTSNPLSVLLGKADFLFNMTFVVSLAALVFSFNAVSGERESGTLRLLIAHAIPRGQILLAKILGRMVALTIPWSLSVLLALIILAASPVVSLQSPEVWPALLIILGVSLLFILGMMCLGVCISTWTRQAMASIVLVFLVWMLFTVVIPKISPLVAKIIDPVEARSVVDITVRITEDDVHDEFMQEIGQQHKRFFDGCGLRTNEVGEVVGIETEQDRENLKKAKTKYREEIFPPLERKYQLLTQEAVYGIEQDYRNRKNRQMLIAKILSRLSPVSCFTYVVSGITRTGLAEPDNFLKNAQRYQDVIKEAIYDNVAITIGVRGDGPGGKYIAGGWSAKYTEGWDWKNAILPDMQYRYPTLTETLNKVWPDILLLGLFDVLFFVLAFVGFNRYDVR